MENRKLFEAQWQKIEANSDFMRVIDSAGPGEMEAAKRALRGMFFTGGMALCQLLAERSVFQGRIGDPAAQRALNLILDLQAEFREFAQQADSFTNKPTGPVQ
jgi:hypothetical protein